MSSLPLVSTIIPVYNRENYIAAAILSVIKTDYPNLEVVVVDDGSTDQSFNISNEIARIYPDKVVVYQHHDTKNHGISASRNLGIKKSRGDIICFLDSDDIFLSRRFKKAINCLIHNPRLIGAYEPSAYAEDQLNFENLALNEVCLQQLLRRPKYGEFDGSEVLRSFVSKYNEYGWVMPGVTIKREAFELVGLFNPTLSVGEDVDLWIRLASTNRIVCVQDVEPVALVRRHSSHSWDGIDVVKRSFITAKVFISAYKQLPNLEKLQYSRSKKILIEKIDFLVIDAIAACRREGKRRDLFLMVFHSLVIWPKIIFDRLFWGNLIYGMLGH